MNSYLRLCETSISSQGKLSCIPNNNLTRRTEVESILSARWFCTFDFALIRLCSSRTVQPEPTRFIAANIWSRWCLDPTSLHFPSAPSPLVLPPHNLCPTCSYIIRQNIICRLCINVEYVTDHLHLGVTVSVRSVSSSDYVKLHIFHYLSCCKHSCHQ